MDNDWASATDFKRPGSTSAEVAALGFERVGRECSSEHLVADMTSFHSSCY